MPKNKKLTLSQQQGKGIAAELIKTLGPIAAKQLLPILIKQAKPAVRGIRKGVRSAAKGIVKARKKIIGRGPGKGSGLRLAGQRGPLRGRGPGKKKGRKRKVGRPKKGRRR